MSYIDDKLEIVNDHYMAKVKENVARARLSQLMQRWGYGGPLTATAAKTFGVITIRGMMKDETWVQDGPQIGVNWQDKLWKQQS